MRKQIDLKKLILCGGTPIAEFKKEQEKEVNIKTITISCEKYNKTKVKTREFKDVILEY